MNKIFILILLILLIQNNILCGTIDPKVKDETHIDYGNKHTCVVRIEGKTNKDNSYFASAVLIKPRWILTAAHVVKDTKSSQIIFNDRIVKLKHVAFPTEFDLNISAKNDIALGYLESDCYLPIYPELYTNNNELGKICSIAGFGMTGSYKGSIRILDRKKRGGSNIVNSIHEDLLICDLKDTRTSLEFLIANGDSGGGLFIDQKLAGINSCVMTSHSDKSPDSNINDESGHTRVSKFVDWIEKAMEKIKLTEEFSNATIE